MSKSLWLCLSVLGGAIAVAFAASGDSGPALPQGVPSQHPPAPAAASEPHGSRVSLLHAQRFLLEQPAVHWWRAERPKYARGWLVVLEVDPTLVIPRELEQPVLYVGAQTAERVNKGHRSGRVVAIVPGDAPLAGARAFFGRPGHPETIDAAHVARELALAERAGATAIDDAMLSAVEQPELRVRSQLELHAAAIELVARHSQGERDLIDGARVEQAR